MNITQQEVEELKLDIFFMEWYLENQEEDLIKLLHKATAFNAIKLFTSLMAREQCIKIALFASKDVLHIFEDEYVSNRKLREMIELVENYLKDPSLENKGKVKRFPTYQLIAESSITPATCARSSVYALSSSAREEDYRDASFVSCVIALAVYEESPIEEKQFLEKIIIEAVRIIDE